MLTNNKEDEKLVIEHVLLLEHLLKKGVNIMIQFQVDEETAKEMMEKAINERVEEIARSKYFLTYNELSEYVNMSKPTIEERLIKNGLKYYKVGNKYLFRKEEIDQFLDEMTSRMDIPNNDFKHIKLKKGV